MMLMLQHSPSSEIIPSTTAFAKPTVATSTHNILHHFGEAQDNKLANELYRMLTMSSLPVES